MSRSRPRPIMAYYAQNSAYYAFEYAVLKKFAYYAQYYAHES